VIANAITRPAATATALTMLQAVSSRCVMLGISTVASSYYQTIAADS